MLEGYIVDYHIKDVVEYCRQGTQGTHYANRGAYNILFYNKSEDKLEIKTDKRTTLSLYVYEKAGVFAYSNNPWLLVKQFYGEMTVDVDSLKAQACFILPIIILPVLCLPICRGWTEPVMCVSMWRIIRKKSVCYWAFTYTPDPATDLNRSLEKADSDFTYYFKTI